MVCSPYFGAEFQFEVPRQFRYLNVYVYDKNDPAPNGVINGALGKVAIAKKDLQNYGGKDQWFPIVPIDADSEVKGKIHLEVSRSNTSLTVRSESTCCILNVSSNRLID
jgi:Ras GTPase-activating protein 3